MTELVQPLPQFISVEECLAFICQHSAELVQINVDVDEADAAYLNKGAEIYACTAEEFLSAITMMHIAQQMSAQAS